MDNDKKMDDAKPIEPVRQKSAIKDPTKAAHDVEKTTKATNDVEKTTKATNDGEKTTKAPTNDAEKATKKLLTIKSPTPGVSFPMGRPSEHGPKEVDIRRKSSWGSFSRVVLCAIDASPCARYAFECEHDYRFSFKGPFVCCVHMGGDWVLGLGGTKKSVSRNFPFFKTCFPDDLF